MRRWPSPPSSARSDSSSATTWQRSRLTVVFRLFLAIPLFVWVVLRGIAAGVVGFVNWLAVLIQGEVPDSLHGFVASYIRYSTQVSAYVFLAATRIRGFAASPTIRSTSRSTRRFARVAGEASSGSCSRCRRSSSRRHSAAA